jgi:DNA invertase Pin-like site-specific DNA recombinase
LKGRGPLRAVTYHRVSTLDQDPTLARRELERACAARGWTVVATIEETGSGARHDRPGWRRVTELVRRHQVDAVVCWKLDRIGRSALDVLAQVDALDRAGVALVVSSQGLETGGRAGPLGRMVTTVLAAIAEFERDLIRERTRLAVDRMRAEGRRVGRPLGALDKKQRRRRSQRGFN